MNTPITNLGYKKYLGDAVYVDFDGYALVLMTENGEAVTNRIYLEQSVWEEFNRYVINKEWRK